MEGSETEIGDTYEDVEGANAAVREYPTQWDMKDVEYKEK